MQGITVSFPCGSADKGCMFLWWPGKNYYSLAGKFWFLHHIHQTLPLQISIYFSFYKSLLMEKKKTSISWTSVKGTWNNSLLRKIKSFGKVDLWNCFKNDIRWWNKMVNMLFNKGLGKNENKIFLFLLKNQRKFLANPNI